LISRRAEGIDYFVVVVDEENGRVSALLTEPEKELFKKLEKDYKDMKCDLEEQATAV
jgi:hypothetical protein